MARTIIVHFYCLCHGHPSIAEIDLDTLGERQIDATREAHLKDVHFRFAAASDAQYALTSLVRALGPLAKTVPTYKNEAEFNHAWLLKDRRLPVPTPRDRRPPTNAYTLAQTRPHSLLLGYVMWQHLQALAKAELWMPFHGKIMARHDTERPIECNALIVGHNGVIEAVATVPANQSVPLAEVQMLAHGDILRYTAQWTVDDSTISEPTITAIDHFPCPIRD